MIEYKVLVDDDDGNIIWLNKDNQLHCEHGPAVEHKDGHKVWYKNGYKAWYKNDKRHNLNGPAVIFSNGNCEYWIDGKELTEDQFKTATSPVKELTVADIETLLGYKVKVVKG